ncbi:hypothetical protein PHET_02914 [Paragonimus heterotremus]|uniref:Uncharacterized protein n=1 Tax=Paragonimus heterotremus TaxID=100268 RepID=A0A8J4TJ14_9TREM|nr:hypothetical protein PHET_02914 [Paragonimus heterotremus]
MGDMKGQQLTKVEREALQHERSRLENTRESLEKEHEASMQRVYQLERSLLQQTMRAEEKEIINLLCRLHELELERADLDARYALSGTELKRREFLLDQLRMDSCLSEAIIRYQADLLAHNKVETPKELEQLLELYEQQTNPGRQRRLSVAASVTDIRTGSQTSSDQLHNPVSTSLSSIPIEAAFEGSPYLRTATWLHNSASRRASCTDALPIKSFDSPGSGGIHDLIAIKQPRPKAKDFSPAITGSVSKKQVKNRSRSTVSRLVNTKKSVSQSQPEFTTLAAQACVDGVKSSESSSLENVKPVIVDKPVPPFEETTRSITALARQRKDQKLREEKHRHRQSASTVGQQISVTLSDIGESGEHQASSPVSVYFTVSPTEANRTTVPITANGQRSPYQKPDRQARDHSALTRTSQAEQSQIPLVSRPLTQPDQFEITTPEFGSPTLFDLSRGPPTRPIKVIPMELKNQKKSVSLLKEPRPRKTTTYSEIPRSRSTPRYLRTNKGQESSPILQVPQIVKLNDQFVDDVSLSSDFKKASSSGTTQRKLHSDMPLQQKTVVDRRQH